MSIKESRSAREVEKIEKILDRLQERAEKGTPIIVEGKNDREALKRLKISGRLIELKSTKKSVFNRLEYDVPEDEVIVFTDFDRRGTRLAKAIKIHFESLGKRANLIFWRRMKGVVGRNLKDIEGLPSYIKRLKDEK